MNDFDEDLQQDLRQEVSQAERRHDDQFESEPFVNSPVDRSQLDVDPERLYSRPVDGLRRDRPDRRRTSNRPLIEQEEERKTFVDDGDGGGRQSLPSEPGGQGQRQARAMIPDVLEPGEERDRLEGKVGTANGVSEWGQVISGETNAARRRGEGRYGASAAQSWTGLGLKAGAQFGGTAAAVMTGPLAPVTKKVIDRGLSAIGEVTQYVGDKRREAVDPQGLVEHQALIDQANIFHQGVDSSGGTYNSNVRTDVEPDERRELNRREAVAELGVRFEKRENAKRNWAGRQQRTGARVAENVASVPLRAVGAMVKGVAALPKQLAGFFGRTIPKYARKAWKGLTTDKSRRKAATAARLQQDLRKPDELAALEARGWDNMGRTYGRYFTDPKVYARRQLRSQLAREAYERGDDQSAITESRYYQKKSAQWTKDAKKERDAQKKFDEDKGKAEKDGKPAPTNSKIAFYRNREKGIRDEVRAMQSRLGYDRMVGMSDVKTLGDATSDPRQKFLRGDANAVENSAAYGTVEAKYATPDMTAVMDAAKRDLWAGHDRQSVGDEETRLGNLQHRPPRSAPPEEQNSSLIKEELKEEQNQQEPGQVPDQKEPKIAPKPAWPGPRAADVPQTSRGAALGSGMADFGDKLTKALIKPAKGLADNAQLVGQALGQGLPSALLASQNYQGLEDMAPFIEFGQNVTDFNKTNFKGPMDTLGVPLYGDALGTVADSISAGVQARHRQDDAAKTGLWKRQAVTDLQRMGDAQKLLLAEKKSRFGEGSPEVKRALRNRFRNAVRLASANQKLAKAQSGAGITSLNEYSKRETDFINQTIDKPDENPVFTRPEKAGSRIANAGSRIAGFFRRKPAPAAVIDAGGDGIHEDRRDQLILGGQEEDTKVSGGQDQLLAGADDSYEQADMSRLFEFAPRTKAIPADMGMLGRAAAGAQRKQQSTHLEDLDPEALGRQAQKYQVTSRRGKEGDEDDTSDGAFDLDNLSDQQDVDDVLLPRSGNSGRGDAPQQRERRSTIMRRVSSSVIGSHEGDVASLGGEGSQNGLLEEEDKGEAPQQRERRSTIMRRVSSSVIGSHEGDVASLGGEGSQNGLLEEEEKE